ncbi:helix-turn-helix transcriptional regulator [Spirochaetota bacterium]
MQKFKTIQYRLLFIDNLLRKEKYPNCSTMAKEYEVSPRTIQRDIDHMRDMLSAPIEYDKKKRGFYYTELNYQFPSMVDLKESEFFAICIAQKALEQYENTPIYEKLSDVFDKIRAFLPESIKVNTSWIDTRYSFMEESHTDINPETWEIVSNSLRNKKELKVLYMSPGKEPTSRCIHPYHIVNFRGQWYIIGHCCMKDSMRRFAVSRIKKAEITSKEYAIPKDFDFDKYMGSHFGIMTDADEYTVKVQMSPSQAPYVRERTWHPDQEIKENDDGSLVISFRTNSLLEVKRWILSWGSEAKVIEPQFLVDEIKKDLQKTISNY